MLAETSDGSEADVTEAEVPVYNERQKVEIRVTKCDKENPQKMLEGAVFGLYAAEDIKTAKGEVFWKKELYWKHRKVIKKKPVVCQHDLPLGKYEVREIAARMAISGQHRQKRLMHPGKKTGWQYRNSRLSLKIRSQKCL